jgi:hypothetical protein
MALVDFVIPIFVAFEVMLILVLYRYVLRDWIIEKWEEKLDEDGWLIIKLNPVIDEIEDRMHDKLEQFQSSFFGSVGQMVKKGKELDPMNNIRKAAKDGDWTSMLVEYAANKSGLGAFIGSQEQNTAVKEGVTSDKTPQKPKSIKDFLHK